MAKIKIEVRKPQPVASKQATAMDVPGRVVPGVPAFFRVLLVLTYACSALALWFVFQRFSLRS